MTDRYASLKQGLVGCWIPSISGSGLLLPDLSGRGNNGSLVGMDASDWVSASYGRALDFDGVNDYVLTSNAILSGAGDFTVTNFFKINTATRFHTFQGNFTASNLTGIQFGIFNTNKLFAYVASGSSLVAGTTLNANQWYSACAVRQNGVVTIYLNGVPDGSATRTGSIGTLSNWRLGQGDTGEELAAQLDDARVYNRALTESEIKLLASEPGIGFKRISSSAFATRYAYSPPKARNYGVVRVKETDYGTLRQGLVGAWCPSLPNGGSGNLLVDQSQRGNHGVLTNMSPDDWVSAQYGRALDFGDPDDVVSIGKQLPNISGQPELTIAMWAKRNTATGVAAVGQADASDPGNIGYWHINLWQDGNAYFQVYPNFVGIADNSTTWNFWLLTLKNSQIKGYRNGVEVASTSGPASVPAVNGNFQIGKYWINGATNSQLDDIRIYSRALSESEIKLLASRPGIGLRQDRDRNTFYQFPSGARRRRILTGIP